jgi:hypothetical protein
MSNSKIIAPYKQEMTELERFLIKAKWGGIAGLDSQKDIILQAISDGKKPEYVPKGCYNYKPAPQPICNEKSEMFIKFCNKNKKTKAELYSDCVDFILQETLEQRDWFMPRYELLKSESHCLIIVPCIQELADKLVGLPFFMHFKQTVGIYQEFEFLQVALSYENSFDHTKIGTVSGFGRKAWRTTFNSQKNQAETVQISG